VGVSIPTSYDVDVTGSFGSIGPVTLGGIPDTYHIDIEKLPQIDLKLEPVELNLAIKELPSTRTHMPANFSVGLMVMGTELLCIRLCGESQIITEPYRPNPCEVCSEIESRTAAPRA